jgi:hypothetical protein
MKSRHTNFRLRNGHGMLIIIPMAIGDYLGAGLESSIMKIGILIITDIITDTTIIITTITQNIIHQDMADIIRGGRKR